MLQMSSMNSSLSGHKSDLIGQKESTREVPSRVNQIGKEPESEFDIGSGYDAKLASEMRVVSPKESSSNESLGRDDDFRE